MKNYLKISILNFLLFSLMSIPCSYGQNIVQKDIFGRVTLDSLGNRINYDKSDEITERQIPKSAELNLKSANAIQSNDAKGTLFAKTENLFTIMGASIGKNSMNSVDLDNDGIIEVVCTAGRDFFQSNFWYVMKYDSLSNNFIQEWVSFQYSNNISTLKVIDFNNDKNSKIVIGFENGVIQVYDGQTKELVKEVQTINDKINSIIYADADNDSEMDIVVSCYYNTYILDASTFSQKSVIRQGANFVRVGNVDDDSLNEVVLSTGFVYQLNNSEIKTLWRFYTSGDGLVELSDIDNDFKEEIVFAESWQRLNVFDAESGTTKFILTTDQDINVLYLKDVNNDGVDDIIYGDGQWGSIHCYNSLTRTKIWSVKNPEHGVSAINIADINNDGKEELIWGAGWSSTGSDYLYIYNFVENKLIWRSDDVNGPFYAITTGDVDGDGIKEIVTVSYSSESYYKSGELLIIDSKTNRVKWRSDPDFLYMAWFGIYNISIKDIDNDGSNEIILAAGQLYTGAIWIIDGKHYAIKSFHLFSSYNNFQSLAVEDTDNDGNLEFIVANDNTLLAINPEDWSIKWEIPYYNFYEYRKAIIKCADFNLDGKKEIVVCKGAIQVVDGADQSIWTSQERNYINFEIFDYNEDGVPDIIASTADGHIKTLDGNSKSVINEINPETTEISSVRVKKNGDSIIYIYSCNGRINFFKNNSNCLETQFFGNNVGEYEGLKIYDQIDTSSILFGTPISVLKIPGDIDECFDFKVSLNVSEPACDKDDGKILLNVSGGKAPYKYLWNDQSELDSLTNLSPGDYSIKISDSGVCIKNKNINLSRAKIDAYLKAVDEGCKEKGSVKLIFNHINEPYTAAWSNSETGAEITNLTAGEYSVVVKDSKNCIYENMANVLKDTLVVDPIIGNVNCYGYNDGAIFLNTISGIEPVTYLWNDESTEFYIRNRKPGNYSVRINDASGCTDSLSFEITQPDIIKYDILTSPDDLSTPNWEGKIMIDNLSGGTPPYYEIYWPRFQKYTDYLEVLPSGKYQFIVTDINLCQVIDTAIIGSLPLSIKEIEVSNDNICEGDFVKLTAKIKGGKPPYFFSWSDGNTNSVITVYPVETTTYSLKVTDSDLNEVTSEVTIQVKQKPVKPYINSFGDTIYSSSSNGNIWMLNGEIISNENDSKLAVKKVGWYSVRVENDDCLSDISQPILKGEILTLKLDKGWNIFSLPFQPVPESMEMNFRPLINNNSLVKIQNEDGNSLEDWGIFGGWTNGIGNISPEEGYKIKVNAEDSVEIIGSTIEYPFPIPLKSGWNIIGYPQFGSFDGMNSIVKQLIERGTLEKVQDESGSSIENWGIFGGWTNNIGDFAPGQGYKLKVNAMDTLWIINSYEKSSVIRNKVVQPVYFKPDTEGNGSDHMNINLVQLPVSELNIGDEFAVFDDNVCVGAVSMTSENLKSKTVAVIVSAFEDERNNGFKEGNRFILKLWRGKQNREIILEPEIIEGTPTFVKNETSFLSLKNYLVSGLEGTAKINKTEINCYPNPFGDRVTIEINLENTAEVQIEIINQQGQNVRHIMSVQKLQAGIHKLDWNGRNDYNQKVSQGVYYLKVSIDGNNIYKKLVYSD